MFVYKNLSNLFNTKLPSTFKMYQIKRLITIISKQKVNLSKSLNEDKSAMFVDSRNCHQSAITNPSNSNKRPITLNKK